MKNYPNLFREGKLGKRTTKNRIVMSPMGDNMANADGSVSEQSLAYYTERAKGGAGVIIAGVVSVDYPRGKTIPCQHRLDGIKYVKGWERMARDIHRYGALLLPQIHHAGASTDLVTTEGLTPYRVSDEMEKTTQVGSKVDEGTFTPEDYQTLTYEDIKELEQKFITCAVYAQKAGCDGVEIHGISYLICQFFTRATNHRADEYGGSLENRCRFAVNIIKGIREACGADFIIGIRMPVHKWETDGFTDEESIQMAQAFEKAGCDFLDANGGIPPTITCLLETQRYEQGDRVHLAKKIREHVSIPVFAIGNLREPDFCEEVLASGSADFVMLGRPLIADPYWPEKAENGKADEIRKCISCLDACYGNLAKAQSVRCVLNPTVGYESELKVEPPVKESKRIVIVGGGLAGMQAAITANERGHEVIILEESGQLAGQMNLACKPPHKAYVNWAIDWFTKEIGRQSIKVELNKKADLATIKTYNPDLVFVATGSKPWAPKIEGIEY
ncbi:MAG TPA: FAD-dependent oxidoreductase, partial [Anaerovoracaceae bacterium]|nr:FAD-dependent oxidoreductase [Anaerovoracaceae bacterium]